MDNLERLAKWIESHGVTVDRFDGILRLHLHYTCFGRKLGGVRYEWVRTLSKARDLLGY